MPKRKKPEMTPEEQFKRFQEAAKRAELDESGRQAEQAFTKIAKRQHPVPERRLKGQD